MRHTLLEQILFLPVRKLTQTGWVLAIGILFIGSYAIAHAQFGEPCYPIFGCTGTSTIPTAGQVLQGGSNGRYDVVGSLSLTGTDANTFVGALETLGYVFSPYFTATSTTATSTFPRADITKWISQQGNLGLDLTDDGSDLVLHADVGGVNKFVIDTDGAFFELFANPGPANDYLLCSITETQGDDTQILCYEEGDGNNRFAVNGSVRIGGGAGSTCDTLGAAVIPDCDTAGTGADLVLQDDFQALGDIYLGGSMTASSSPTFQDLTAGSVLFTGTGGALSQDNSNFFWDDSNNRLGVGTTSPWGKLSVEMDTTNPSFVVGNQGSSTPAFFVGGVNQNGRVGIGGVPTEGFEVFSGASSFRFGNNSAVGSVHVMDITTEDLTDGIRIYPGGSLSSNSAANAGANLQFFGKNASAAAGQAFITYGAANADVSGRAFNLLNYSSSGGLLTALTSNASELAVNESAADFNFRVEGDTDTHLIFADAGTDRVGVGTSTPGAKFAVEGDVLADAYLEFSPLFVGDALSVIKDIAAEPGTTVGDWAKVDHATLPLGISSTTPDGIPTRDMGRMVQFLLKANQQLLERIEVLEAQVAP